MGYYSDVAIRFVRIGENPDDAETIGDYTDTEYRLQYVLPFRKGHRDYTRAPNR